MAKRRKQSEAAQKCAICGKQVSAAAESSPFCSERCRLVDLGKWLGESYRISRPVRDDDELSDEDFGADDADR